MSTTRAGPMPENPYDSQTALDESSYLAWTGEALVSARDETIAVPVLAERIHSALRAVILDPEFPCVGARSAMNQAGYRFSLYDVLDTEEATAGLARDLFSFVQEQDEIDAEFTTFLAVFDHPKAIDAVEFERLLWSQLKRLNDVDGEPWDPSVSSDPQSGMFSFSFAGRAFFVVGLSPTSDRWARRFPWPALAFNAHAQFERLRATGGFSRMQEVVRTRDRELEGDINPNLSDFGAHTDARQYSGRPVEDEWRCPVQFRG